MSAERYEITDDGTSIIIAESSGIRSTIDPVDGHHLDDAVIGAIRQQARDIAELRADYVLKCTEYNDTTEFARGLIAERDELRGEIARHERNNTHIGKMFDQLRTDLAAAVAERDKLRAIDCGWIAGQPPRNTCEHCDGTGDVHTPTGEWVGECDCVYAQNNKLRAFKSAVEAAPVVACASYVDAWKVFVRIPNAPMPPIGTELIARPAKD